MLYLKQEGEKMVRKTDLDRVKQSKKQINRIYWSVSRKAEYVEDKVLYNKMFKAMEHLIKAINQL